MKTNSKKLLESLEAAFNPDAIAIVGASGNPTSFGYDFLSYLLDYGYSGKIYPVNPNEQNIRGLKAYPSLSEVPGTVDYVICCIAASRVPALLRECPQKGVKVVHLFTGRLSETGRQDAQEKEREILHQARELGIRLIGPNCMGVYHPRQGIAFNHDLPQESGWVGGVFQSGGASGEFVRYGGLRGLRFSKVISYGNAIDIDESDLLEYLSQDEETKIIATYSEGVKNGQKLLATLRRVCAKKPIVVLKGGRGLAGTKAAASHTASVAGSTNMWNLAIKQAGAIQASTLNELIDIMVSFYFLPPITGKQVCIVGGGGGKSVLSADECEEAGLNVAPLTEEMREELKNKAPEIWDWVGNPADRSIMGGTKIDTGEIMKIMARGSYYDFIIANLTEDNPFGKDIWSSIIEKETDDILSLAKEKIKPVAAVMGSPGLSSEHLENWRWKLLARERGRLIAAGVPVFSSSSAAAKAISQMIDYYLKKENVSSGHFPFKKILT